MKHYLAPLLFILILLITTTNIYADECGVFSSKNFKGYSCPPQSGKEATISTINFNSGEVTCEYGGLDGELVKRTIKTSCDKEYKRIAPTAKDARINGKLKTDIIKYANRLKTFGIKVTDSNAISKVLDVGSIDRKITKTVVKSLTKNNKWNSEFQSITGGGKIDSTTDFRSTVSSIVGGVFTLDPFYFTSGMTNAAGEIQLKNEFKSASLNNAFNPSTVGVGDAIKDFFISFGKENSQLAQSISNFSPVDMFDKQKLGYLLSIGEAFRKIFNEMITVIYLFMGVFSAGYYTYVKAQEKKGKETFQINNIAFAMTAALSFTFFAAPVSNDGQLANASHAIDPNSPTSASNYSSLAQEVVRTSVQIGSYYANKSGDYVLKAHLGLIAQKMGVLNFGKDDADRLYKSIEGLREDKVRMQSMLNFYSNVCVPYFGLKGDEYFVSTGKKSNASSLTVKNDAVLRSSKIKADRLSHEVCGNLEREISNTVLDYSTSSNSLRDEIDMLNSIHNTSSKSFKGIKSLSELMVFGNNAFGWVFSAPAIPVSYFFFENSGVFLYDKIVTPGDRKQALSGTLKNQSGIIFKKNDISTPHLENTLIALTSNQYVSNGYWFLVPGFSSLYNSLDKTFQRMYMSNVDLYNKKTEEESMLRGIVASIAGLVKKGVGKVNGAAGIGVGIVLDAVGATKSKQGKSKIKEALLSVLAFIFSVLLIKMAITAFTSVAISALIAIKIVYYYIETLLFFLILPVYGIPSVIMSKQGAKNPLPEFGKRLINIMITPILLMLIASLLVPLSSLFISVFSAIMELVMIIIKDGETFLRIGSNASNAMANSTSTLSDIGGSIQKIFTLMSIEGMVHVFSYLIILVFSLWLITVHKELIFELANWVGSSGKGKELASEIKGSTAGKTINGIN